MKRSSPALGLTLFLALLFLLVPDEFYGPDYFIYTSYIQSVAEDGDLNIIDEVTPAQPEQPCNQRFAGVEVTPTFNAPDFHNHGGVLFWIPFYYYGKGVGALAARNAADDTTARELESRVINNALCFSTVALAFLACVLLMMMTTHFFGPRLAFWAVMAVFWGSPAFFYTICQPGNANIVALLVSVVMVLTCASSLAARRRWQTVAFGMLLALALAIKIDLWFVSLFVGGTFLTLLANKQTTPTALGWLGCGIGLVGFMKPINDYLRYDTIHAGEAGLLNLHNSYHLEQMFSPYHGYFSSSPLLLACLSGLVVLGGQAFCRRRQGEPAGMDDRGFSRLLTVMASWLAITMGVIGFRFAWGGDTFGARQLMTFLPLFVLLMAYLMKSTSASPRGWVRLAGGVILVGMILINWLHAGEFLAEEPIVYYLEKVSWQDLLSHYGDLALRLGEGVRALPGKLLFLPPLVFIAWLGQEMIRRQEMVSALLTPWDATACPLPATEMQADRAKRLLAIVTVVLASGYALITTLNLVNNRANVASLKADGCFQQARILSRADFEADENAMSMEEMIFYFWKKGDVGQAKRIMALRRRLYPGRGFVEFEPPPEISQDP